MDFTGRETVGVCILFLFLQWFFFLSFRSSSCVLENEIKASWFFSTCLLPSSFTQNSQNGAVPFSPFHSPNEMSLPRVRDAGKLVPFCCISYLHIYRKIEFHSGGTSSGGVFLYVKPINSLTRVFKIHLSVRMQRKIRCGNTTIVKHR